MRSIEIHLLETASDIDTALLNGLLLPSQVNGLRCAACADDVGHVSGGLADEVYFESFAVLLDERDEAWFVCHSCLEEVIEPIQAVGEKSRYSTLFDEDEEFDRFDLLDE
jgi:hypothetical protein